MHQPPRQAGEMISVQVGDEDLLDTVGIDVELVEADQRGGTAIDDEPARRRLHTVAGLQAAARSERVAASNDRELHGTSSRIRALQSPHAWTRNARLVCSLGNTPNPPGRPQALALGRAETS